MWGGGGQEGRMMVPRGDGDTDQVNPVGNSIDIKEKAMG